ncbi:hypothetical protein NLJ89_g9337 [Agrocybe chaxingu]|uniref:Diaminopimelate epimerase-like protein n=1 Tax=Agrocybe chaxingu TaxID=84603 RepID=A0A9W8K0S4_9AGAR|nr:hypothetical protein NLJ89_g9337 [Agrocybe chaxingu]
MASTAAQFFLVTAFSSSAFGGNPAGIVFLDTTLPPDYLGKIAQTLNQPMISVVSPVPLPSDNLKATAYSVRFFATSGKEVQICGHGTLAAAKVIFELPEVASSEVDTIHFKNLYGNTLTAVKRENGFVELKIPSTVPGDVSDEEKARLKVYVDKAFGRDVKITDMKTGGSVYSSYIMTEIDENENLAGSSIDPNTLIGNGYTVNIFTSASSSSDEEFVSRMISPGMVPGGEDHVCGSAHGTLTPYWHSKRGIKPGVEVKARPVSPRGGELRVTLDDVAGSVILKGQATVFATGQLHL